MGEKADPVLLFSLEIDLQINIISKHKRIGELYLVAYASPEISQLIAQRGSERNQILFQHLHPDFSWDDFYQRTLAIKGILHSFLQAWIHDGKDSDFNIMDRIREMCLLVLNITPAQIQKYLFTVNDIIQNKSSLK